MLPDEAMVPASFAHEVLSEVEAELDAPSPELIRELTIRMWQVIGTRSYLRELS